MVIQCEAIDLVRFAGSRYCVTRDGYEPREFDDWDEAYEYFNGDRHIRVERTLHAL